MILNDGLRKKEFTDMPYKEHEVEKVHFTSGDIAKECKVSIQRVHDWEKMLGFKPVRRDHRGRRIYTKKHRYIFHTLAIQFKRSKLELIRENVKFKELLERYYDADCERINEEEYSKVIPDSLELDTGIILGKLKVQ